MASPETAHGALDVESLNPHESLISMALSQAISVHLDHPTAGECFIRSYVCGSVRRVYVWTLDLSRQQIMKITSIGKQWLNHVCVCWYDMIIIWSYTQCVYICTMSWNEIQKRIWLGLTFSYLSACNLYLMRRAVACEILVQVCPECFQKIDTPKDRWGGVGRDASVGC